MGHRARSLSVSLGSAMALVAVLVASSGLSGSAQSPACELVASWELTGATGAAFGPGEESGSSCVWRTETPAGHLLTITLDVSQDPPVVTIDTDDPSIDAASVSSALATLVASRIASGDSAPPRPPADASGGERPALCELISAEDVTSMLGVSVKPYGSQGDAACGYLSDDPERISVDVLVAFERGALSDIPADWPDAAEVDVAGLEALAYGWEVGSTRTSYLSVDTDAGMLTAKVKYDDSDLDPATVARGLIDVVLEEMSQ